jgi:hypothetical protein
MCAGNGCCSVFSNVYTWVCFVSNITDVGRIATKQSTLFQNLTNLWAANGEMNESMSNNIKENTNRGYLGAAYGVLLE